MKYQEPLGAANSNASYVDGNPSTGVEGSPVPAAAIEHTMREIVAVITASGLTPSNSNLTQLNEAIGILIGINQTEIGNATLTTPGITKLSNSLISESQDVAATSLAAKKLNDAIQNLNSLLLVGTPIPWPSEVVPSGYLQMRGQSFDPVAFPQLAAAYPSNILEDMRGEFIRGWDDGRGVDPGRLVLSSQNGSNEAHDHGLWGSPTLNTNSSVAFLGKSVGIGGTQSSAGNESYTTTLVSGAAPVEMVGGPESRPRNVAFMYITRAA